jgi:hypothetical protein
MPASHALSQHGPSQGAQERGPAGLGRLTAAGRGRRCATRRLRAAHAQHHQRRQIAELDAHNSSARDRRSQVRTGLPAGGRWIRTIGPAKSAIAALAA